jgi:hypothetical protein
MDGYSQDEPVTAASLREQALRARRLACGYLSEADRHLLRQIADKKEAEAAELEKAAGRDWATAFRPLPAELTTEELRMLAVQYRQMAAMVLVPEATTALLEMAERCDGRLKAQSGNDG